ncbi:sensor histidine kinase [Sulfobacillus harzensis]|uniref:histidine kinase n=1 Tax=Sulfobacillus harzensis TaxID=2729629 RepID=A0A7Y0L7R6_9FIRM|nr:ATP-binding protein [Sulfobacillus harzensis]NMP24311.1 ATP-binding protein [Sulfobacillus harzensis]
MSRQNLESKRAGGPPLPLGYAIGAGPSLFTPHNWTLTREAHPDRRFEVHYSAWEPILQGDPLRLEAVIRNLVDNAVKYSPSGSTIRIELAPHTEGLHLRVADEGLGIPSHDLPRVFDGFFRGSNLPATQGGMGLGLYLCRQIIERHGGRIWAESQEGRGTTFHVVLPRERGQQHGARPAS